MSRVRKVLVTGGCGSIGAGIVTHLSEQETTQEITVFDNDEQSLYALKQEAESDKSTIQYELGDVRDEQRLRTALQGVDHVIHAAGIKQVPQSEFHPYEAMMTNSVGTWNVLEAAKAADVTSVLTVSTDKAVNPISTMGASKLLAERMTRAADSQTGADGPRFGCVRLGNVVGSAGSVVPLFRRQIEDGGPITVTDPEMTRFVMSERRAASFIVDRLAEQRGGVHVPKLGRMRLGDLARAMREAYAPPGTPPEQIEIQQIGRRPGERFHEYLVGPTEVDRTVEHEDCYTIRPPDDLFGGSASASGQSALPAGGYRSDTEPFLDAEELVALVDGGLDATSEVPSVDDAAVVANYDSA